MNPLSRLPLPIAALLLAGAVAPAAEPPGQIAVSPSKFELTLGDAPKTEAITLLNLGDTPVTIDVSTATWDLDEQNRLRLLDPDEQSLDRWMVINPLRFTIPARESQTVRFSVRPRVAPTPGEHRAMIYFDQVLPEAAPRSAMRVKFRVGVAVYGFAGAVRREGQLHAVRVVQGSNPPQAWLDVSSEGNAHVRLDGRYVIFAQPEPAALVASTDPPDNEVLVTGALPSRPVLPSTRREIPLRSARELPPGRYVLAVRGTLAGQPIEGRTTFKIERPDLLAATQEP